MKTIQLFIALTLILVTGCSTSRESKTHVELVRFGSDRRLLTIIRQEWDGAFGPHGYTGYREHYYDIKLVGNGSLFSNPAIREDRSPSSVYHGTVALDMENMRAILNIQKISPDLNETNRNLSISGKYKIDSVRDATPTDRFAFPDSIW